jgi:hypothetical protein
MRKTLSDDYTVFAHAAGKTVHWKVSLKKTASLSEAQSAGTWIDVTPYLSREQSLDGIRDSVELSFGKFTASSIQLTGLGIAWWKANIFNAANYLEAKVEFWINNLTADTLVVFGGWVDKKGDAWQVKFAERGDTAAFTIFSYAELGERMSAADVTAQPVDDDVDGAGTDGLTLTNIPGIFVTDAAVATYVLKKGIHVLTWESNAGTERMQLDDGTFVNLPVGDGSTTLINGDGTQKVTVYVKVTSMPNSGIYTQDLVVTTEGDTLPRTWHQFKWIFRILEKLYAKIGITSLDFDDFAVTTRDSRSVFSFYEPPIGDVSYKRPNCIAYLAPSTVFMGTGDKLVSFDLSTRTWTNYGSFGVGYTIMAIWLNVTNTSVYIVARNAGNQIYCRPFDYEGLNWGTLSSQFTTSGWGDYQGSVVYCAAENSMIYVSNEAPLKVRAWDFDSNSMVLLGTGDDDVTHTQGSAWITGGNYYFPVNDNGDYRLKHIPVSGGAISDDREWGTTFMGEWNPTDSRFYGWQDRVAFGTGHGTYCCDTAGAVTTKLTADFTYYHFYNDDSLKVECARSADLGYSTRYLSQLDSGSITNLGAFVDDVLVGENIMLNEDYQRGQMLNIAEEIFCIRDAHFALFKFSSSISMFVANQADFEGMTVGDAIKELCIGFNLVPRVGMHKKAYIYLRGDGAGNVVTTGESVALNADRVCDISEETGWSDVYDIVVVDNGVAKESWGADGLGAYGFLGEKELTIPNRFIPTSLLSDYAFWFYQFYKNSHSQYIVPTPLIPYFQYEPFDAADLTFAGKVAVTASGVILGQAMSKNGETEFEVFV